jgi:leader peptidase (prepilin peptidase)/N-methyltransferase
MEQLVVYIVLGILGLCMGSFAGASTWRLRARQLAEDKADGEEVSASEYKKLIPLTKASLLQDRSRCLHCGHLLAWYDLLPLVSWISTRGKCRYCHKKIGYFEPLIEISVAAFFVASYAFWPAPIAGSMDVGLLALWLVAGVLLAILFAYDAKWFLLPNRVMFPLIAVAAVAAFLQIMSASDAASVLINVLLASFILSGLYLVLWLASRGQWVGFGDVKLGLALALLLADWQLAFIALFAANFIGCLVVIPGMLSGKITRKSRVPFGPLLILGGVIAFLFGGPITEWYMTTLMGI